MQRRYFWVCLCWGLTGLTISVVAHAASDVWDGNGLNPPSGVWGVGANWVDNTTPGNSDTASFALSPFVYTVTFTSAPAAIQALSVTTGAVTFTSSGGAKTLNVTSATGGRDVMITSGAQLHLGTAGNPLNLTAGDDLSIQPGAVMSANYGSVIEANDFSSSGLNGVLSINNTGLTINADSNIGGIAGNGTLALTNGAQATFGGSLGVADSTTPNAYGALSIQSGSSLMLEGNLSVATGDVVGQVGTITIEGGAAPFGSGLDLEWGLASYWSVTVGSATNGTANINILSGGHLSGGGGPTTINATGTVTVASGSWFYPRGDVIINGGTLNIASASGFDLYQGNSFTIQNGGSADFTGVFDIANGSYHKFTITGAGSTWSVSNFLDIGDSSDPSYGAQLLIEAGGSVSSGEGAMGTYSDTSTSGTSGATITGAGSNWTVTNLLDVGKSGRGALSIKAGGTVSADVVNVGVSGSSTGSSGTILISGAGSTLNTGELNIGNLVDASGRVTVETGGIVNIETELALIGQQAIVNLNGGRINLDSLRFTANPGTFNFNFNFGTLNFTSSQTISLGDSIERALGGERRIRFGQQLGIEGTLTLNAPFQIDGGHLEVASLVPNGNLQFTAGTLGFTGAGGLTIGSGGPLGSAVTLAAEQTLNVTNTTTINSGALLVVGSGGNFSSRTVNNSGEVVLDGASATARSALVFNNAGMLRGRGRVDAFLNNQAAGEVRASVGEVLQFINASGSINSGRINLLGGTIEFTQAGLFNAASGQIVGFGSLVANGITNSGTIAFSGAANVLGDVDNNLGALIIASGGGPTTFFDDVVNNGVIRTSAGSRSVFFGSVTGTGSYTGTGTVNFEGDLSPGSSPGLVNFGGNVEFGSFASLAVELAGTNRGSEFDALDIAGLGVLDGTLDVQLMGGFAPVLGDTFEVIVAAQGINGTFTDELLPDLGALLDLRVIYEAARVTLAVVPALAGDYNANGTVDAPDYVLWRNTQGQSVTAGTGADGNSDGQITTADFSVWRSHFGQATGAASGAVLEKVAVPEPPNCVFVLLAVGSPVLMRMIQRPAVPQSKGKRRTE